MRPVRRMVQCEGIVSLAMPCIIEGNNARCLNFQGTVIIIANHGDRIDIPSGAILENKIVSGNLRILDH